MKNGLLVFLGILLMSGVCLPAEGPAIRDEADRVNYSIGYQIGGDFLKQGWKLNPDLLVQGIRDALAQADPLMPHKEMNATLVSLKRQVTADQQEKAKKTDAAFLAENAKRAGVTVLSSGVQYKIIKEGTGKRPTLKDQVTVRYHIGRVAGMATAGNEPDSKPRTYPLNKALPGLQEVLQLMKEGSVWQVILPPGPAVGSRGEALERAGVLVYELELISVQPGS